MAGGIFGAFGAALQQGGRTFGALTEQENLERQRREQLAQQKAQFDAQFGLQQKRFDADEQDRHRRIVEAAIEFKDPGSEWMPEEITRGQQHAPEMFSARTRVQPGVPQLNTVSGLGEATADNPLGVSTEGPAVTPGQDRMFRAASRKEQSEIDTQTFTQAERDRIAQFRTHAESDEHANESFDQRAREHLLHTGQQLTPDSAEWERRQALEHQQALERQRASAAALNPRNTPGQLWLQGYNQIADNVRAKYSSMTQALARAAAEGDANAEAKLNEVYARIARETETEASQMLGPRPGAEAAPPPGGAGTGTVDQIMQDFAEEIQTNPQGLLAEIAADPALTPEIKAELTQRIQTQMKQGLGGAQSGGGLFSTPQVGGDSLDRAVLSGIGNFFGSAGKGPVTPHNPASMAGQGAPLSQGIPSADDIMNWIRQNTSTQDGQFSRQTPTLTPSQRFRQ